MNTSCPLDAIKGFMNLTTPPTVSRLEAILVKGSPLIINFAPRTTPPSTVNYNTLDEGPSNTVLYKGSQYSLLSTQIALPTHTGYVSNGLVVLELTLTFWNSQVVGTYPSIILFVLPILLGTSDARTNYLLQLINPDATNSSVVTLQDLFANELMLSYGYKSCLDLVATNEPTTSLNMYVLYFPYGIFISEQDLISLASLIIPKGEKPPVYKLPAQLLNGRDTVSSYFLEDGEVVPSTLSSEGLIGTQQLSSATDEFTNVFQYFSKPPSVGTTPTNSCPAYTTAQYKCLPFNKFYDLSANLADPSHPQVILSDLLNKQQPNPINLFAGTDPWSVAFDIFMVLFAVIILGVLLYVFTAGDTIAGPPDIPATGGTGAVI